MEEEKENIELQNIILKMCSICLDQKDEKLISFCTNCNESGNTCNECLTKWVEQKHNPIICTICKQETKKNISEEINAIYKSLIENDPETTRENRIRNVGTMGGRTSYIARTSNRQIHDIVAQDNHEVQNNDYLYPDENEIQCKDLTGGNICCSLLLLLLFSYIFSAFSYYMIFRLKGVMFVRMHIALGCGSVIALPVMICFRKNIKRNCFNNS